MLRPMGSVGDVQHNSAAPMTTLTELMGLWSFAQGERCPNDNVDVPLVYQLREGLQELAGDTGRHLYNVDATLLGLLL